MSDHGYNDVFVDGEDLVASDRADCSVPYRSVIIYRYYDEASKDFGTGETPPIEHFAKGLGDLILKLRDKMCADKKLGVAPADFRVYLVAHSMGGLVVRAFLQNPKLGNAAARACVDKVFTYATPHNGIDMRLVRNVPGWLSFGDVNNFNRERMAGYLAVPKGDDVSVVKNFPPERIFNLVGTNANDYRVLGGVSAWAAGDASDGLVRIENATTHGVDASGKDVGSPRAFVHRSHSGYYGIVNSEEGYQNLTRFLFGSLRVDGLLDLDEITLPPDVQKDFDKDKQIRASYQFEIAVSVRGCQWQMTRREVRENSAIFRTYDELFPKAPKNAKGPKTPTTSAGARKPDRSKSPYLFSVFLDPRKSVAKSGSVSFAFDLKVLVPDYEVDGVLFLKRHYEGGFILRKLVIVEAFPDDKAAGGWKIKYGYQDRDGGKCDLDAATSELESGGVAFEIPVAETARPGLTGRLRLEARSWS